MRSAGARKLASSPKAELCARDIGAINSAAFGSQEPNAAIFNVAALLRARNGHSACSIRTDQVTASTWPRHGLARKSSCVIRDYCSDSRSWAGFLAARTIHLNVEPFFTTGRTIGTSAPGIESLQQSVWSSKLPGFFRFRFFTHEKKSHSPSGVNCFITQHELTKSLNN